MGLVFSAGGRTGSVGLSGRGRHVVLWHWHWGMAGIGTLEHVSYGRCLTTAEIVGIVFPKQENKILTLSRMSSWSSKRRITEASTVTIEARSHDLNSSTHNIHNHCIHKY